MLLRFVPKNTNIDFIGKRYMAFVLSAIILIGSVALLFTKGLNFGIDFTGGTLIEIQVLQEQPDLGSLRNDLNALELGTISIQEFGAPNNLLIRLPQQGEDSFAQQEAIETTKETLDGIFEEGIEYRRIEFVGPQVGEELQKKGMYAVLFSILGMLVYIWFRFEWQFSAAAIIALVHDSLATIGLFALTQMEFNLSTVAAILMIAGYSINDTVVVFDRIRENLRKYKKMPVTELLNKSVNNTLSRTIMTSITTLLALAALWAFGGEVIRGFVNALIFGIVIGTYSSIFVAAPILTFLNIRHKKQDAESSDNPEEVKA
ncbi:MAG: protein translocase subunit SecF [Pseudomonadota bacterium]